VSTLSYSHLAYLTSGRTVLERLPCIMRNGWVGTNILKFAWYVPVGAKRYRYLQLYAIKAPTLAAKAWAHVYFWSYARWAELVQFNNQDTAMVARMPETPPDRFYRPDASITAWRRFCERARGLAASPPEREGDVSTAPVEQGAR
jgi:hypothetical protein